MSIRDEMEDILPRVDFERYVADLVAETEQRLSTLPPRRAFVMLSGMDTDCLACTLLLRYMFPERQLYLVYPRLQNRIDFERQSRRDALISYYRAPVVDRIEALPQSHAQVCLCEFQIDAVYAAYSASVTFATGTRGLSRSNDLGLMLSMYAKTVADATSGYVIGSLNGTSLRLGDFYRHALDADFYPLSSLFRTDVLDMIRMVPGMPGRLKDELKTSPWQQKVRDRDGSISARPFGKTLAVQRNDGDVLLLSRQFFRLADPVMFMRDVGMGDKEIGMVLWRRLLTRPDRYSATITSLVGNPDGLIDAIRLVLELEDSGQRKLALYQHTLSMRLASRFSA